MNSNLVVVLGIFLGGTPTIVAEPLKVTTQVSSGPYHVGQAVEIRVDVEGIKDLAIAIESPRSPAIDFHTKTADPGLPSSRWFIAVLKRAGTIDVPPFRARIGDRSGSSRPTRLTVVNIPAEGRSAAFLGGVGKFEVKAEAEPTALRSGGTLEYQIKMTGPAAWSSERTPDLSSWNSLGGGFRVDALPDVLEAGDPPSRTFRYRLRAIGPGRVILPPVAIAAFDPKLGRFATRTTSGLPILVERPTTLDPDSLDYQPIVTQESRSGWIALVLTPLIALLVLGSLWFYARKKRNPKRADPEKLARSLGRSLDAPEDADPPRRVMEAMTIYLERVGQRAPGVLTPLEAREAFDRLTSDRELAEMAERLVVSCDRAAYGKSESDPARLIEGGQSFFGRVAEVMVASKQGKGGSKEAVETAREV